MCDGYHGCFPEDGCFDVKEDRQCNWIYINEAVYVEERKAGRTIGQHVHMVRWKTVCRGMEGRQPLARN